MCKNDKRNLEFISKYPLLAYKLIIIVNGIYYKDNQEDLVIGNNEADDE